MCIRDRLNTLDDPLIDVIELAKSPPVQDSAKDKVSFFLVSNFKIFKDKLLM